MYPRPKALAVPLRRFRDDPTDRLRWGLTNTFPAFTALISARGIIENLLSAALIGCGPRMMMTSGSQATICCSSAPGPPTPTTSAALQDPRHRNPIIDHRVAACRWSKTLADAVCSTVGRWFAAARAVRHAPNAANVGIKKRMYNPRPLRRSGPSTSGKRRFESFERGIGIKTIGT